MTDTAVVLPVKRLAEAKQRLSPGMSGEKRRQLMAAMLSDSVEAISGARAPRIVIVVTNDPEARAIAERAKLDWIADEPEEGHSAAARHGIAEAVARGAEAVALLPADCPLLESRDVDHLLTGLPSPFVTVVPDRHGTGTNGLVLSPPDAIDPAFGEGSCRRHVDAARAAGIPHLVDPVASLGLDLDTPADIVALAREIGHRGGRNSRTAEVLGI